MDVVIAVLYETEALRAAELRWPLRLAASHGGEVTVVVPTPRGPGNGGEIDLGEGAENEPIARGLAASLRGLLDQELAPEGWVASGAKPPTDGEAAPPGEGAPVRVALRCVPREQIVAAVLPLVEDARRDLLVPVLQEWQPEGSPWRTIGRELMREARCQVVYVVPGRRQADGEILFETAHGQRAGQAASVAWQLARRYRRKATGLWVEPPIGPDSKRAGGRMLDRALEDALGDEATHVDRRVEVQGARERGFLRACEDERYEVLAMGTSRPGAAGLREVRVPARVLRGTDQPTMLLVRSAMPLRTRLQRLVDFHLRRTVPQLERQERTGFVANVHSSSQWNFDFIALMGLATGIATLGLIGDSGAVIIGAMLVAPLMTPLMGIGLSIVQGNMRLASMTSRTAALGFVLAFALAFTIGTLDREFGVATGEMYARHWPSLVDLAVAFVAGLAAAYASGRPGLLAALPGVAIAASLVPPIATSGLAVSLRNYDLAIGAILLFLVNVVAIVLATAFVLWAVGLRGERPLHARARLLAAGVAAIGIATTVGLALSTPRAAPPLALVKEIEAVLGIESRVRHVSLKHEDGPVLQIDLGGDLHGHPEDFGDELRQIARRHLGKGAAVRLSYRHEALLR